MYPSAGSSRNYNKIRIFVGFAFIQDCCKSKGPVYKKILYFFVFYGGDLFIQKAHLYRIYVQSGYFIVLRQEYGALKADVSYACYCYVHGFWLRFFIGFWAIHAGMLSNLSVFVH